MTLDDPEQKKSYLQEVSRRLQKLTCFVLKLSHGWIFRPYPAVDFKGGGHYFKDAVFLPNSLEPLREFHKKRKGLPLAEVV